MLGPYKSEPGSGSSLQDGNVNYLQGLSTFCLRFYLLEFFFFYLGTANRFVFCVRSSSCR